MNPIRLINIPLFIIQEENWHTCGRAESGTYRTDLGKKVFAKCPTNKPLRFSCGDSSGPRFTSNKVPAMNLLSKSCKKVDRGWLNRYGSDYMLTIDRDSNPNCNQDNTGYQLYMKFGNYWSCGGYSHIHTSSRWWFTVSYLGHGKRLFECKLYVIICLTTIFSNICLIF